MNGTLMFIGRPSLSALVLFLCCAVFQSQAQETDATQLLENGRKAFVDGRKDEARRAYEDARLVYRTAKVPMGEALVLMSIGELELHLKRYDGARSAYEAARGLYKAEKSQIGEAKAWLALGDLASQLSRGDEAAKAYEEAKILYAAAGDSTGEALVLVGIGDLAAQAGRSDEARRSFEKARSVFQSANSAQGGAKANTKLGDLEAGLKRDAEARKAFESALSLYRVAHDRLGEIVALAGLGRMDVRLGRPGNAAVNFRSAAAIFGERGMTEEQALMTDLAKHYEAEASAPLPIALSSEEKASASSPRTSMPLKEDASSPSLVNARSEVLPGNSQGGGLLVLGLCVVVGGFLVWKLSSSSPAVLEQERKAIPTLGRRWLHYDASVGSAVVFVHGILSNPDAFKNSASGVYWPELLYTDSRFGRPNVFLGQFYTDVAAGSFDIPHAAEDLRVQICTMGSDGKMAPISASKIIFIAHSTGGLVVRDLLTRNADLFRSKTVGLVLLASPSRGSAWADRLSMLIALTGNRMAGQLQRTNEWVRDLDRRFADFVHKSEQARGFKLRGTDLFENRFILSNKTWGWLVSTKTIVVDESESASYFGAGRIVPDTDHFSVAKPDGLDHPSHRYLTEWWLSQFEKV